MSNQLHHWEPKVQTGTYATQFDVDAGDLPFLAVYNITATGNIRVDIPTNGRTGQRIGYLITASGGARTLTIESGIVGPALTDSGGGAGVIASGKTRYYEIQYNGTEWFSTVDREEA